MNGRGLGVLLPLDSTGLLGTEDPVLGWTHGLTCDVNTLNLTGLPSASSHQDTSHEKVPL